ncbi:class I SAM-dependent methyltransferase [Halorussus limi]|uniref:class I SAM-dependent methyltransferase n=1 Tax=Halorussus limi TaxID=2938695 RepID=UPI0034A395C7
MPELRQLSQDQFFDQFARLCEENDEAKYEWLDPVQADWTLLGEFDEATVLEIGRGYGGISQHSLSKAAKFYLVDSSFGRLKAAAIAANTLELDSLTSVAATPLWPPFKNRSFDRIIDNGFLHCISDRTQEVPGHSQRAYLKRINSLLRTHGELYIRARNWFSPYTLLDNTSNLSERALEIARTILRRLTSGKRLRTRRYTKRGYERLLHRAGFCEVEVAFGVPDHRSPVSIFSGIDTLTAHLREQLTLVLRNRWNSLPTSIIENIVDLAMSDRLSELITPALFLRAKKRT